MISSLHQGHQSPSSRSSRGNSSANSEVAVFRATTTRDRKAARAIREAVFVREQGIAREIELDGHDATAAHLIATVQGLSVGTARWRATDEGTKLERFAVLPAYRRRGVATALLRVALSHLQARRPIYLHAQEGVVDFYARRGFAAVGEPFVEAGIVHRKMVLRGGDDG